MARIRSSDLSVTVSEDRVNSYRPKRLWKVDHVEVHLRDGRRLERYGHHRGEDVTNDHPREVLERGRPSGGSVFPDMSVKENLRMGAYLSSTVSFFLVSRRRYSICSRARRSAPSPSRRPQWWSTDDGRVRTALMPDPDILLLDEPSAGLHLTSSTMSSSRWRS